jgi:hypothetical protein
MKMSKRAILVTAIVSTFGVAGANANQIFDEAQEARAFNFASNANSPGIWTSSGAVYTYTGNDFTSVTGAYTTSDFLTLTLTLTAPLADNLNMQSTASTNWSYYDGLGMRTFADFPLTYLNNGVNVQFSTDSAGNITNWAISIVPAQTDSGLSIGTYDTPVPGPTIGAGIPGIIVACSGLLVWWRTRRPCRVEVPLPSV